MNNQQASTDPADVATSVVQLHRPKRWHDPLRLVELEEPHRSGRAVMWCVSLLVLVLIVWAALGQLDVIAAAEGKLVPQTLLKVVQPAESGVVEALLVTEGSRVKAGQVLARLNTTVLHAELNGVALDLAAQQMQVRRIEAELRGEPMSPRSGDDPLLYAQVQSQHRAHRTAISAGLDQERALLLKARSDREGAAVVLAKLEQTLPTYKRAADAYVKLEREGFLGGLASADKQREAIEKAKDLDAQYTTLASLDATIAAQQKRISQIHSNSQSELRRELADLRARIAQLQPNLDRSTYRAGLMELRAPQDGLIKDLATTTVGAVVQPGTVLMTLIPQGEQLFADVSVKNQDAGFVRAGQRVQVKLATYPFQRYGMLHGTVIHVSADATESAAGPNGKATAEGDGSEAQSAGIYKARVRLDSQQMRDRQGGLLALSPGMQVVAEINHGKRSVIEYLLSPVQKTVAEAGRER